MRYRVRHTSTYSSGEPVSLCQNMTRLEPLSSPVQTVSRFRLEIAPTPAIRKSHHDFFGNAVTYFAIEVPHDTLVITAISEVETHDRPLDENQDSSWESVAERIAGDRQFSPARAFTLPSAHCPKSEELRRFARESFEPGRLFLDSVSDLNRRIFEEFTYDPKVTTISTPVADVLEHRSGVCQDFSHLAISALRSLELPARYVSGYIETVPPPGKERLVGADASHAWFSVYSPEAGWIDFDPTNNLRVRTQHITVATGRDFADVSPIKGVLIGSSTRKAKVSVDVAPL